jgi:uncharacterized membrane protein YsdA (DUF1294 family)
MPLLVAWLVGINVVTAVIWAWDKSSARRPGARRVRERTLMLLALAGGVAGAWLVFLGLRHKTLHRSFWIVLAGATILWVVLLGWLLLG